MYAILIDEIGPNSSQVGSAWTWKLITGVVIPCAKNLFSTFQRSSRKSFNLGKSNVAKLNSRKRPWKAEINIVLKRDDPDLQERIFWSQTFK